MPTESADQHFNKIIAESPCTEDTGKIFMHVFAMNLYESLAIHVNEIRSRIGAENQEAELIGSVDRIGFRSLDRMALIQYLDRNEKMYEDFTGLPVLPDSERGKFVEKLSAEYQKRLTYRMAKDK